MCAAAVAVVGPDAKSGCSFALSFDNLYFSFQNSGMYLTIDRYLLVVGIRLEIG